MAVQKCFGCVSRWLPCSNCCAGCSVAQVSISAANKYRKVLWQRRGQDGRKKSNRWKRTDQNNGHRGEGDWAKTAQTLAPINTKDTLSFVFVHLGFVHFLYYYCSSISTSSDWPCPSIGPWGREKRDERKVKRVVDSWHKTGLNQNGKIPNQTIQLDDDTLHLLVRCIACLL